MKTTLLAFTLCIFMSSAFVQNETFRETPVIKAADFTDPVVKRFYDSYPDHLLKCIKAIREKNEAKATALFKNPGEQLVAQEKIMTKEVVKNAVKKQKYIEFATQVYPYIKEVKHSAYYKKIYGNDRVLPADK